MKEKIKKSLRWLTLASMLTLGAGMHYSLTHKEVEDHREKGTVVYNHPDEQTTHILNYIAGKEPISREERREFTKKAVENYASSQGLEIPQVDKMSEYQLMIYIAGVMLPEDKKNELTDLEMTPQAVDEAINAVIPLQRAYDPTLYRELWNLEREVGSPCLRWVIDRWDNERKLTDYLSGDIVSYNFLSNTVYVWPVEIDLMISEFAHARQFNHKPVVSYWEGFKGALRTIGRIVTGEAKSFGEAYQNEYAIHGSLEYEAHTIIEPDLRRRVDQLL